MLEELSMNKERLKYKFVTSVWLYLKETWKNKLVALLLVGVGLFTALVTGDGTALVLLSIIATPLFLSIENWIC
jgi:hypothetical protein